jgi:sulfate adenylyltransferase
MARLDVNQDQYLELEKIALGAFAPLTGFLEEGDFISVVESMRLGSGKLFPLPVVLDVSKKFSSSLRCGDVVSIFFRDQLVGEIAVSSIYTCDSLLLQPRSTARMIRTIPVSRIFSGWVTTF